VSHMFNKLWYNKKNTHILLMWYQVDDIKFIDMI
jgi:hypothetical protein